MDLKELNSDITIDHWYYNVKFLFLRRILYKTGLCPPSKKIIIAEIGAGSGIFTKAFLKSLKGNAREAYAVDNSYPPEFLGIRQGVCFTKTLPEGVIPTHLFFIDVLEHIENEVEFLKNWVKKTLPNSCFIFSVPAFQCLWSSHDDFLKHKRRYSLKEIEKIITTCGLKIKKSCYFFLTILPVVFFLRKVIPPLLPKPYHPAGIKQLNPVLNFLLKSFLKIEVKIGASNKLCGLSCIVVAVKP